MGEHTGINWTDATFNPWWGCTKISPGCDHCYAEGVSQRFAPGMWGADSARREFDSAHFREPLNWNRKAMRDGKVMRVFSGSMCDVFENHPTAEKYRPQLFALIMQTPWLCWQLLTKRIGNVHKMVPESWLTRSWPRNVWIGATIVNQAEADRDIPKLLALPGSYNGITNVSHPVKFLSCEPLLGPLNLSKYLGECNCFVQELEGAGMHRATCSAVMPRVDWVICGGESGNGARPMHPAWPRQIRDQCAAADVPFLFKQWGEFISVSDMEGPGYHHRFVDGATVRRVGKKIAGRLLDGIVHTAFPKSEV